MKSWPPGRVQSLKSWAQVGAYGLPKDAAKAEHYLRRGAVAGDLAARRNLGLLLLELDRSPPRKAATSLCASLSLWELCASLWKVRAASSKVSPFANGYRQAGRGRRGAAGAPPGAWTRVTLARMKSTSEV